MTLIHPQIKQEGENIEFKARLEEEIEEGCTVTWYFNETKLEESSRMTMEFDGTFAKLFLARYGFECLMTLTEHFD